MRKYRLSVLVLLCISIIFPLGCHSHENKKTRKITVEGPETKREIKIESTEKKKDND